MNQTAAGDGVAAPASRRGGHVFVLAFAIAMMVVALLALAAGPVLYRAGLLDLQAARADMLNWVGVFAGVAGAAAVAGIVLSLMSKSSKGAIVGVLIALAALLVGFRVIGAAVQREGLPPIHDAQTDWDRPVAFTGQALAARQAAGAADIRDDARIAGDPEDEWNGMTFAEAQAQFWELAPLHVDMAPAEATVLAEQVARQQGWTVMLSDPPGGQIEAVQRSFWYGLPADIAVRIVEDEGGARIDVRSASRIGGGDMGANAQRIKVYLDDLAQAAAVGGVS